MSVRAVSIVGKQNEPLFFLSDCDKDVESLSIQSIVFSSLDIIEEKRQKGADLFLGHLLSLSEFKAYGLCSNTNIKVICVCDAVAPEISVIREVVNLVLSSYIAALQNPFQALDGPVTSRRLENVVRQILQTNFSQAGPGGLSRLSSLPGVGGGNGSMISGGSGATLGVGNNSIHMKR